MKSIFAVFLLTVLSFAGQANQTYKDSVITDLRRAIRESTTYDNAKLLDITRLKNQLSFQAPDTHYAIYLQLYAEYRSYNYDSARVYANKLENASIAKNNPSLLTDAKLKDVFVILSGGLFKETFDSLNVISIAGVADSVKGRYYSILGLTYYNLADFNSDSHSTPIYNNKANIYLDSAIMFYAPGSFDHIYYSALKMLKINKTDSAKTLLNSLISKGNLTFHQEAIVESTIAGIFLSQGLVSEAKDYLIRASIADIKSSTKETLALLTLAGIVYNEGNIEDALLFIEKANTDASFYNARLRKAQIGAILPLIEGGMINTIRSQKEKLQWLLILMSILVVVLTAFAIIIRKQVIRLRIAKTGLSEANEKLHSINTQLHQINLQLSESNKIKEEYIGYYFNLDTEFMARVEKLMSSIDKKLVDRKWEEIKFLVRSLDLRKEKDELLKNFDKVFLRLFPNFVEQFNTLFREEDRIIPKDGQLLNSELRIFALIRLGVTENEKIAEILDYSINTIYAKKTKVRSKTIVNKDDFEKKIAEITTLNI